MNRLTKLLAATAAGVALSFAAAASQAAVFIAFDTGSGPVTVLSQADGFIFFGSSGGGFESITVTGDSASLPGLLHTQNAEVNNAGGGPAAIKIYVTHTDITGGLPNYGYLSSFTGNSNRAGFTVSLETRVDANNGLYGGTLLSSAFYNGTGATADNNVFAGALPPSAGLYSVTHVYDISDVGGTRGSSSPSITLAAYVPEPATWALMIMGFGGAGAMIRRRKAALA